MPDSEVIYGPGVCTSRSMSMALRQIRTANVDSRQEIAAALDAYDAAAELDAIDFDERMDALEARRRISDEEWKKLDTDMMKTHTMLAELKVDVEAHLSEVAKNTAEIDEITKKSTEFCAKLKDGTLVYKDVIAMMERRIAARGSVRGRLGGRLSQ